MPNSNSSTELPVIFSATLVSTPEPDTFALLLAIFAFACLRRRAAA